MDITDIVIVGIITIGIVCCVGMICCTNYSCNKAKIINEKLKTIIPTEYSIDHNMAIEDLRKALRAIRTILDDGSN